MKISMEIVHENPATLVFDVKGFFHEKEFRQVITMLQKYLSEHPGMSVSVILDLSQARSGYQHIFQILKLLSTEYAELIQNKAVNPYLLIHPKSDCWGMIQTLLNYYHLNIPLLSAEKKLALQNPLVLRAAQKYA